MNNLFCLIKKKKKEENLRDGRITVIIGFFLYGMHKEYV